MKILPLIFLICFFITSGIAIYHRIRFGKEWFAEQPPELKWTTKQLRFLAAYYSRNLTPKLARRRMALITAEIFGLLFMVAEFASILWIYHPNLIPL
jgi:hypothetical protein